MATHALSAARDAAPVRARTPRRHRPRPRTIAAATPSTTPTFAEAAGPGLEGPDEAAWFPRFDAELDNLRAAVAWALDAEAQADAELGLRIIAPLVGQSFYRPSAGVGEWAEAALGARKPRPPAGAAPCSPPRPGKRSSKATSTSRARVRPRRCATGSPPTRPPPDGRTAALASADCCCRGPRGRAADARGRPASPRRHRRPRLRPPRARPQRRHGPLCGRSARGGPRAQPRTPSGGPARSPTRAMLIVALRWFAGTRRPDETDETIQALEECLAHSRAVATPDAPDVLQPSGCSPSSVLVAANAPQPSRRYAKAVVRAHDTRTVSHVGLRAQLRRQRRRRSRRSGARGDARRCAHRRAPRRADLLGAPRELADRQAVLDHARAQLGPDRYDAAHATGAAMSYEQIVEYTLAELDRLLAENKQLTGT